MLLSPLSPERLLAGDSISDILRDVRRRSEQASDDPGARRSYWLSRQDVRNLAHSLNIKLAETSRDREASEAYSPEARLAGLRD